MNLMLKFETLFKKPYNVLGENNPNVVVDVDGKEYEVHKDRTKKYFEYISMSRRA